MNILSLDGGGIRGVVSARILWRLERECPGFLDKVDVIAGASTGGIQALKIASGGKVTELVNLYERRGNDIFQPRDWLDQAPSKATLGIICVVAAALAGFLYALGHEYAAAITFSVLVGCAVLMVVFAKADELFRSNYSQEHFEQVLKDELTAHKTMRDLDKIVLIPTFDMREWNTKYFDNFPGNQRDLDQKLWEVARCTSAAPTYWPSHQWCLDGGLFANNPSDSAVATCIRHLRKKHLEEDQDLNDLDALKAMRENVELIAGRVVEPNQVAHLVATTRAMGQITVLSIGTGDVPHKAPDKPAHDAGILQVIPMLLNVVMDGAVKASSFRSDQALNGRHVRLQPRLANVIDLAAVDSIPELIQVADLVDLEPAVSLIKKHWLAGAES
jgi:patatin-like phospholipase/acyl hydrolase